MPNNTPTLEAQLEATFRHRVRQYLGGIAFKLAPTHVGMPDRMVVLPAGRIFLVELKTVTGRLSPAQREMHARLAELGIVVHVLYGRDDIIAWVDDRARDFDNPRLEGLI